MRAAAPTAPTLRQTQSNDATIAYMVTLKHALNHLCGTLALSTLTVYGALTLSTLRQQKEMVQTVGVHCSIDA